MKIKTVIYALVILTGILMWKIGLGANETIEHIFGAVCVATGTFNVISILRKK